MTLPRERALAAILLTASTLMACSPADPVPPNPEIEGVDCLDAPAPSQSPTLVPGIVDEDGDFVELSDGSTLTAIRGIQGGTHIDLSARIFVDPPELTILEVIVEGREDESIRIVAEGCDGWSEAFTRVFDPISAVSLTFRLLDRDREELSAATIDVFVE